MRSKEETPPKCTHLNSLSYYLPRWDCGTLKSADLKVSQPEPLSKHSAVSSRDGQKQRQNAEYLCDMKAPSAHCIFAKGWWGPMKNVIVGSRWQNASHHFSICRVWSLTLAWSNTPTLWWIRTLTNPLIKKISLLYASMQDTWLV